LIIMDSSLETKVNAQAFTVTETGVEWIDQWVIRDPLPCDNILIKKEQWAWQIWKTLQ
jgi:hypothetical protein